MAKKKEEAKKETRRHVEVKAESCRMTFEASVGIHYRDGKYYDRLWINGQTYLKPLSNPVLEDEDNKWSDADTGTYSESYRKAHRKEDDRIAEENQELLDAIANAVFALDQALAKLTHAAGFMVIKKS